MAKWINHVAIANPAAGSTTETYNPALGNALTGAAFTPTAGNLLVAIVNGAVTSTTPAGWTLPTAGSAVNNTGLYVFWKVASGADTLTTTHNGDGSWRTAAEFFEFPAGSTFVGSGSAVNVALSGGAGPVLTGLTGTNVLFGAVSVGTSAAASTTWAPGTELVDYSDTTPNKGFFYSSVYIEDSTATSASFAATVNTGGTGERLTFAVKANSAVTTQSRLTMLSGSTSSAVNAAVTAATATATAAASGPTVSAGSRVAATVATATAAANGPSVAGSGRVAATTATASASGGSPGAAGAATVLAATASATGTAFGVAPAGSARVTATTATASGVAYGATASAGQAVVSASVTAATATASASSFGPTATGSAKAVASTGSASANANPVTARGSAAIAAATAASSASALGAVARGSAVVRAVTATASAMALPATPKGSAAPGITGALSLWTGTSEIPLALVGLWDGERLLNAQILISP